VTAGAPLVTIIVPVYNEEAHLEACLRSLEAQTYEPLEIVVVDDGSRDRSVAVAQRCGVRVLQQHHAGKARAIALGAAAARGDIFAFLDGDLRFEPDFVERLVAPIVAGECLGTSHGDEFVANPENVWSRCLQMASGLPLEKRLDLSPAQRAQGTVVYRAVRAEAFRRVGGFDDVGYLDDQTLAAKLGQQARIVDGAVCHHYNPATLGEVFATGSWQGKSVWHRRRWRGLRDYFPLRGLLRGVVAAVRHRFPALAVYVPVVESGIFWGVAKRALGMDRTYGV
jgi:glycosyltransferase involved in cell wall biosynthesis